MDLQAFESLRHNLDLKTLPLVLNLTRNNNSTIAEEMLLLMKEMKRSAESDYTFPSRIRITLYFLYTMMALIGSSTNLFFCAVILFSKKLLRNPSNFLVLNLMASGILMSIFCIPFTSLSLTHRSWIFGSLLCKLIPSLQSTSISVCSATVAMISVDRLVRVTRNVPSHSYNRVCARTHWMVMAIETTVIWILSAGISLPIAYYQSIIQIGSEEVGYQKCVELWPSEKVKGFFAISFVIVHYLGPGITITLCHLKIKAHLERNLRPSDVEAVIVPSINDSIMMDNIQLKRVAQSYQEPEAYFEHHIELSDCKLSLPEIMPGDISNDDSSSPPRRNSFVGVPNRNFESKDLKITTTDQIIGQLNHNDCNYNFPHDYKKCSNGKISYGLVPKVHHSVFKYLSADRSVKMCPIKADMNINGNSDESLSRSPHLNRCQSAPEVSNHNSYYLREINRNKQVTKTLFSVIFCFIVTWLPWNLFNIFLDYVPSPDMSISDIYLILATCHLIAMTTIPLNAFWYGWANPNIRAEAAKFLKKLTPKFCFRVVGADTQTTLRRTGTNL